MNEMISPAIRASSALLATYMSGFGNTFETEALPGALQVGRNSPQKVSCRFGIGVGDQRN